MATYTLFSQGTAGSLAADASPYTMGVAFTVSQNATLAAIWFNSAASAAVLPTAIVLYDVGTQTLIHSETASWSGAAGSGWVRAAFTSAPSLTSGTHYRAAVDQLLSQNWYSATANYWSTGAGSSGVTNGPLSAPNNATAWDGHGQDTFNGTPPGYPFGSFNATNYWVDPEVTTPGQSGSGTFPGAGSLSAVVAVGVTAAAAGTGSVGANSAYGSGAYGSGAYGGSGGATTVPVTIITGAVITGAGSLVPIAGQRSAANLTGAGVLTAVAGGGTTINGAAALTGAGSLAALAVQGATAALTAAGVLTASPGTFTNGAAALTGAGTVAAVGGFAGAANLAALGTVAAPAVQQAVAVIAGLGVYGQAGTTRAASNAAVTDPRDGTDTVTRRAASISGVK